MDFDKPPPEIGPHEGRELALMVAGVKPLAYFSELTRADFEFPDTEFEPHVQAGRIIKRVFLDVETVMGAPEEIRSVYYALPGQEWRIDEARKIQVRGYKNNGETDYDSAEMGRLLGYSDQEISTFLNWSNYVRNLIRDGKWIPPRAPVASPGPMSLPIPRIKPF